MRITAICALAICVIGLLAAAGLPPSSALAAPAAQGGANTPANPAAVSRISFTGTPLAGSSYTAGERIRITVKFDRMVTVTGQPYVSLQIGAQQRQAVYNRGSNTQFLRFAYRVQSDDYDGDGVSVPAGAVNLNGGSIRSTDGDAALTHTGIAADAARKVNDTEPTFGTASIASQNYTKGTAIADILLPAATHGNAPLTYSLTTPPDGLTFTAATRTLSGTPAIGQAATAYTYTVTDADGDLATLSFNITVIGDYDSDDNGLIEVDRLSQLDAIRWDLDGNGAVDTGTADADAAKYTAAFPNPATGMGCKLVDHDDNAATAKTPVCAGYELTQSLDFDTDGDGATYTVSAAGAITGDAGDTYYNGGPGWTPIAGSDRGYTATFDGKGHTIANLFIYRTTADTGNVGLFGLISATGAVKKLGLTNVSITSQSKGAGALAGHNAGAIANCYATGALANTHNSGTNSIGGLVGYVRGGTITNSYAAVAVSGRNRAGPGRDRIGGLVGNMTQTTGAITASYATGAVSSSDDSAKVGGLVGNIWQGPAITSSYATGAVFGSGRYSSVGGLVGGSGALGGRITASYAAGTVTGGSHSEVGGLAGRAQDFTLTDSYAIGVVSGGGSNRSSGLGNVVTIGIINTYWDAGATGQSRTGPGSLADQGKTTRDLQSPTSNTGIYAAWQAAQWDFGTGRQYPAVKHNGILVPGQRQTSIQSDHWNAPVVGEPVTAGLNVTGATSIVWQWQSSAAGATWTNITNAATATYIPVAADAASGGKFLRAQVTFTASGKTQTLTTVNTAKVIAATTAAAAAAPTVLTMVGKPLNYHHAAVTAAGAAHRTAWRWQRCDNAAMTTNCKLRAQTNPATDAHTEYTPVAGTDTDVGKYLRAYVYYADRGNSNAWTRTQTPVLGPVAAAPAPPPATTTPTTPAPTTP